MQVAFELNGEMPLLMHNDNIEAADELKEWRQDPKNKNLTVPGDDRSPAWTWHGYCYTDGEHLVMPAGNIMRALGEAGTQVVMKGKTTFKTSSQSGLKIYDEYCEFLVGGKKLSIAKIAAMREDSFAKQAEKVQKLGFKLFSKRAGVNSKKHIRVRPRFTSWAVRGTVVVVVPEITYERLEQFFDIAGRGGLCDWRPTSPKKPGPFGMFTTKLKRL